MSLAQNIDVFISSPRDLLPERDIVKTTIRELNQSPHYKKHFNFIPYAYEDGTPPVIGSSLQTVVDQYLLRPEQADIFICMMWLRMGTATLDMINPDTGSSYQSGTEYEFLSAYRANQTTGKPFILLYHCIRPPEDMNKLDLVQLGKVNGFFARFEGGNLKGFVKQFKNTNEFEAMLRQDTISLLEKNFLSPEKQKSDAQLVVLKR